MFGTAGARGSIEEVSPSLVLRLGHAVGTVADAVVVGRDGRYTGGSLVSAFVAGAEAVGCDVTRLGEVPTHLVAWTARDRGAHGVAVTASHNPAEDNGVKLFRPDGGEFDADDEERVAELADEVETPPWDGWTTADTAQTRSIVSEYVEDATGYVDTTADLRVAVDTANGVGARTTVPVLEAMGCDVVAVNAQTDPSFPGRGSKPTPESLDGFVEFVDRRGFDLGLAHDGDADRLVVVDADGVVSEDAVLAVLARRHVTSGGTGTVLTTPNTSPRVDDTVREAGGGVRRVELGTVSEAVRDNDVVFAAEPWKHVFPGFGGWVDGTVSAAEVVAAYADDADVFDGLRDTDVRKKSVPCDDGKKEQVMEEVEKTLRERYDGGFDTPDGIRVDLGDGDWFLVRASGTEAYVRVYSEGDDDLSSSLLSVVREAVRRV